MTIMTDRHPVVFVHMLGNFLVEHFLGIFGRDGKTPF